MLEFFKVDNNGEMIIVTDLDTLPCFAEEFAEAFFIYATRTGGKEHELSQLMFGAFAIAFKLSGYKCDSVRQYSTLMYGSVRPSAADCVYDDDGHTPERVIEEMADRQRVMGTTLMEAASEFGCLERGKQ